VKVVSCRTNPVEASARYSSITLARAVPTGGSTPPSPPEFPDDDGDTVRGVVPGAEPGTPAPGTPVVASPAATAGGRSSTGVPRVCGPSRRTRL
jgi:hypothetical protein